MALPTFHDESFGVTLWVICRFIQVSAVNTISAHILWWGWIRMFTLMFSFSPTPFFFLGIGTSWDTMMFTSSVLPSNLTDLPRFWLPPERAYFWVLYTAYFLEYSLITLHSSIYCPGSCTNHLLPLVGRSPRWTAYFSLRFPERPFSGLVGEADYPS